MLNITHRCQLQVYKYVYLDKVITDKNLTIYPVIYLMEYVTYFTINFGRSCIKKVKIAE